MTPPGGPAAHSDATGRASGASADARLEPSVVTTQVVWTRCPLQVDCEADARSRQGKPFKDSTVRCMVWWLCASNESSPSHLYDHMGFILVRRHPDGLRRFFSVKGRIKCSRSLQICQCLYCANQPRKCLANLKPVYAAIELWPISQVMFGRIGRLCDFSHSLKLFPCFPTYILCIPCKFIGVYGCLDIIYSYFWVKVRLDWGSFEYTWRLTATVLIIIRFLFEQFLVLVSLFRAR